jgi:putative DNA primase/helicase
VEHKFKNPFTMRPFATCWFGTNHMPHTRDHSNAIFRRAMILTFNRTFEKVRIHFYCSLQILLFLK